MASCNHGRASLPSKRMLSQQALEIFRKARNSNLFCDAIIRTDDGGRFHVHKCILVSRIPYFNILFTNTLYGDDGEEFLIPGVSKEMMAGIIDYAYVHHIDLDFDNVEDMLSAADEFNITDLVQDCSAFLTDNLRAENCISIGRLAERFSLSELKHKCHEFLMRNFMDVSERSRELMETSHAELITILSNEELNVRDEESVWETAIRWIEVDPVRRKKHIMDLLRCIRLGIVDTDYFMRKIKIHPYVASNEECLPLVIETLTFLSDLDSISEKNEEFYTPELARPRIPHEVVFAIGGWSNGSPTTCIETYDSRADRWIRVPEVDANRPTAYHKCAVLHNIIYVIGGFDGSAYFSGCRAFDVVTKQWRDVGAMHCKRCYVSVAVLDDIIYAMGGYDGVHRQNTAERYDYRSNQWTMVAPMHFQRSDASAITLNGCVYVTGGFNGNECLPSVEFYSPITNQWTLVAPMRSRRSGVSCIAYKGKLHVLGGFDGNERLQSVEKYNPRYNTWSEVPDMLTRRSNFATEIIDDMLFVIGGFNGEAIISQVECYSGTSDEWFVATDMNIYRSSLSACVVGGIPNIRDYVYKERHKLLRDSNYRLVSIQPASL